MNVLVTGASGFIGRWLVHELLSHGHDVLTVDIVVPDEVRPEEKFIQADLMIPGVFREIVETHPSTQVCIHLAAQVGRLFNEDDVLRAVLSNAGMTAMVAKACGDAGIRVVYASTSEVYGDHDHVVVDEFDGPFKLPQGVYGLSKRWGEEVISLYAPQRAQFLRLSMPYGPGAPPGRGRRALDNFLWQAHHRMPIPVHEGATRSWCWVGDTVNAIRLIIEDGDPGPYNVGRDDAEISMDALAREACALAGAPTTLIRTVTPPKGQTVVKRLSAKRLEHLGWAPTVEMHEGLVLTMEWVRQFDANGERIPSAA